MVVERMIRAARLDPELFNEVERDQNATGQAVGVVLIVTVAQVIGTALAGQKTQGIIGAGVGALIGWLIWSLIILGIGKLMGGTADFGEVMRTLAFAYSPGVLQILAFIPILGALIALASGIWTFVATVIAVREAMDFDTGKAVITVLIPFIIVVGLVMTVVMMTVGLAFFAAAR